MAGDSFDADGAARRVAADRCKAKRKEWAKHWQCHESVQNMKDKPWKNEELRKLEEALPRLKGCELEKVSRLYKAKTGVGCDGFHPKVPLDLTKETRGEIVEFLQKVKQSGKWPQQTCTTMFFLIPKNVTSGRNGGAQRTVWEILVEMERFDGKAKKQDQGALALVLDLAKAFERVSHPVVWARATHFSFPREILRVLCGYFDHQRRVQFEGCALEPLRTITAILPGSKWSCLLLRIVLQDALSEVTQFYPPLKLWVFG